MPTIQANTTTRREQMPLGDLWGAVQRAKTDSETAPNKRNTYTVTYSAGAGVRRYDWQRDRAFIEVLEISEAAINTERFARGLPLLDSHWSMSLSDQVGRCDNHRIENDQALCDIKIASHEKFDWVESGLDDGTYSSISVGYVRNKVVMTPPEVEGAPWTYRVTEWTPHENSLVSIPADTAAGTRADGDDADPSALPKRDTRMFACEVVEMPHTRSAPATRAATPDQSNPPKTEVTMPAPIEATEPAAIRAQAFKDAAAIQELCARHALPALATELIAVGASIDAARTRVLDAIATADTAGHRNVGATRVNTVADETVHRVQGITDAIAHRANPVQKLDENSRKYASRSLVELGRNLLELRGVNTDAMSASEVASNALQMRSGGMHAASDFSSILANIAGKRLRMAYEQAAATYRLWARRAPDARDFKVISVTQLGGAPSLLPVNEHGEFTSGSVSDTAEGYQLITRGRIVGITRQAIVNDDLRAFDTMIARFGAAATRLENQVVYAQLTANALLADGLALFVAGHANLGTGGGSVLSLASLKAGRTAMRLQKGLQAEELNLGPEYLIVPAALEQDAYQFTSSAYVPATASAVNEFRAGGRTALTPVVEPLLDANSATAWYLAANNNQIDTVEYCFLEGSNGARIEQEIGFDMDGIRLKCAHDFAAKAIDFRGLYKSNGA